MLNGLKTVLATKGISVRGFAEMLGVSEGSARNKLSEETDFTYREFKRVCALFPEYSGEFMFRGEGDHASDFLAS